MALLIKSLREVRLRSDDLDLVPLPPRRLASGVRQSIESLVLDELAYSEDTSGGLRKLRDAKANAQQAIAGQGGIEPEHGRLERLRR